MHDFYEKVRRIFTENEVLYSELKQLNFDSMSLNFDPYSEFDYKKTEHDLASVFLFSANKSPPSFAAYRTANKLIICLLVQEKYKQAFKVCELLLIFIRDYRHLRANREQTLLCDCETIILNEVIAYTTCSEEVRTSNDRLHVISKLLQHTSPQVSIYSSGVNYGEMNNFRVNSETGLITLHQHHEAMKHITSLIELEIRNPGVIASSELSDIQNSNQLLKYVCDAEILLGFTKLNAAIQETSNSKALTDDKLDKALVWAKNFEDTPISATLKAMVHLVRHVKGLATSK